MPPGAPARNERRQPTTTAVDEKPMRIALDAMGGDGAPDTVVRGAVAAAAKYNVTIKLVGDEQSVRRAAGPLPANVTIVHAADAIRSDENVAAAVRRRRDSSIVVAASLVRQGEADAVISAGPTGATMAAALFFIGRVPGVSRPAIATPMPTPKGVSLILDAGANTEARPEHLLQFAYMGAVYAEDVFGIENPRVGLLNVGEEPEKGTPVVQNAYDLLDARTDVNFVGNIEGTALMADVADVIVSDGFVGNITLKLVEGVADNVFRLLRQDVFVGWRGTLAGLLARPALRALHRRLDYAEYGGAPLLGINGTTIIAHGRSDERAVQNAIRVAAAAARHDLPGQIATKMATLSAKCEAKA